MMFPARSEEMTAIDLAFVLREGADREAAMTLEVQSKERPGGPRGQGA
jgi:hypothetical protein